NPGVRQLPERSTEKLAEQLAYQQGRRDSDVDARLLSHDRHLNRLDTAIERHAEKVEELRETFEKRYGTLDDKLDTIISAQGANAAVEADRDQQKQRGFTRMQTWGVWAAILVAAVVSILCAFIASGKLF